MSNEKVHSRLTLARPGTRWRRWLQQADDREQQLAQRQSLSAGWQWAAFCLALLATFSRSPRLFFHAWFYAEDGVVWYADAYNTGWLHSLTIPDGGYLNTLQRLAAGPALLLPFAHAALFMMIFGLLIQCLPVPILLSARCRDWAPLPTRIFFALIYVVLPAAREVHVVLTNSQWHLALVAALLSFASPPESWRGKLVDALVFLVAGFSGPFGIVLVPFLLIFWWSRRQGSTLLALLWMAPGVLTQVWLLMHHHADRNVAFLGATTQLFIRMLGGEIMMDVILGARPFAQALPYPVLLLVAVVGIALYIYSIRSISLPFKLFTLFCLTLLPPELKSPLIGGPKPLWALLVEDVSARYWFFPMLAFVWCAAWCALHARNQLARWLCTAMMIALPIGIVSDWSYNLSQNVGETDSVQRMSAARPGELVVMKVLPIRPSIFMQLRKK